MREKPRTYLEIGKNYLQVVQIQKGSPLFRRTYETGIKQLKSDQLRTYLRCLPKKVTKLSLVLPSNRIYLRTFYFPAVRRRKLESMLALQFPAGLPLDQDQLNVSYYVECPRQGGLLAIALAVACAELDYFLEICQDAGFIVETIIPAPLLYYFAGRKKAVGSNPSLFLEYDETGQHFVYTHEGILYLRSAAPEADLAMELKHTLSYIKETYHPPQEVGIYANGSYLSDQEQLESLSSSHNLRCTADFWRAAPRVEQALKGKDFLYNTPEQLKLRTKKVNYLILCLGILLILVNMLTLSLKLKTREQLLTKLKGTQEEIRPIAQGINEKREEYRLLQEELEFIKRELKSYNSYLPWLKEFSRYLPSGVIMEQISLKDDKLALFSGKYSSAVEVMDCLQHSPYLTDLSFIGSIMTEQDGERFKIVGMLRDEIK